MSFNGTNISDIAISTAVDQNYSNNTPTTSIDQSFTSPYGTVFTIRDTTSSPLYTDSSWSIDPLYSPAKVDSALTVTGDAEFKGKLKLGNKDLGEILSSIESRLAILTPNKKLEEKWNELKELGDKYRQLEKEILEKEKIYNILSK